VTISEVAPDHSRYRWIDDRSEETRYRYIDEGWSSGRGKQPSVGQVSLFARGQPVALNRAPTRGANHLGAAYLGNDLLGSIRSRSDGQGNLEDRYEYDAFGVPYSGSFEHGPQYGYTGKPYDPATGLYNYGYRDYAPDIARFTTMDPIRDGNNWFAYVNNDPVNYVDPLGLDPHMNGGQPSSGTFANPLLDMKITSPFGMREDATPKKHDGIDLHAPKGTPVYAAASGKVMTADLSVDFGDKNSYLIVKSNGGYEERYVHMDSFSAKEGDQINKGDLVGYTGTRRDVDPHLHFEIRKDGKPIDPTTVLPSERKVETGKDPKKGH